MGTREKIIDSAVTLFVEQGVAGTTTREIAKKANVAEGSIYRYFPSKEELAWIIFHDHHILMADNLKKCADNSDSLKNRITKLVECFLKLADENWIMFCYYLTSQYMHMHKFHDEENTPYKVVLNLMYEAKAGNKIRHEKIEIITAMVMGAVHQIATNKIYGRIDGDLYQHKDVIVDTISKMVNIDE